MCTTLAVSLALGAAQAASGIQQQNAAYAAQRDAVRRSNHMATTKYANELTIAEHKDKLKGRVFEAQLKTDAAAKTALFAKVQANQIEADRASVAAQLVRNEAQQKALFESQDNLVKSIQAQGTVLSSGSPSGNSLLAQLGQAEREFGFVQAGIDASTDSAVRAYGIEQFGINLDKYSSDVAAMNDLRTTAVQQTASFEPIKPLMQADPRKPSILGPILSGVTTTLSAGSAIGGDNFWQSVDWKTGRVS